jgi:putative flippase GtrA
MILQLIRYGAVTVFSYLFLLTGMYVLVDFLALHPGISYCLVLSIVYIGVYIAQSRFVFKVTFTQKRFFRYLMTLALFWVANNLIFNLLTVYFSIHYMVAALINIVGFGLIRFFIQKKFVFEN